jgi:hypothetical protein
MKTSLGNGNMSLAPPALSSGSKVSTDTANGSSSSQEELGPSAEQSLARRRIHEIEESVNEILEEIQELKCDLLS